MPIEKISSRIANALGENDQLKIDIELLRGANMEQEAEIDRLRAEVEALRKCCTQRGARMQIMREWMDHDQGIGPPNDWWYFCEETPGAEHWFDADGVPIEDAALRGEGEK